MSVSYIYLNADKRQFFHCGLLGFASSMSAIGSGPGVRALAILLSERGAWRNDRIAVVGDTSVEFDLALREGVDIEVEAELMLIDIDGLAWVEELLEKSVIAFRIMCAFALHLRHPKVMRMLDSKFGAGKWQRKYENELKGNTDFWSQKIVEAGLRRIQLFA